LKVLLEISIPDSILNNFNCYGYPPKPLDIGLINSGYCFDFNPASLATKSLEADKMEQILSKKTHQSRLFLEIVYAE